MSAPIYKGGRPFFNHALRFGAGGFVHLPITKAGAPVNGTSGTGAGNAGPGSICIDYTNAVMYINTGTKASPTWSAFETSGGGAQPAATQTLASPASITSATYVMLGAAGTITPVTSGRILLSISGILTGVNGATVTAQGSYGTGTAPVAGAAVTGTQAGNQPANVSLTGALQSPFAMQALVTGLTVGTAYWLDVALKASTGAASGTALAIIAQEF